MQPDRDPLTLDLAGRLRLLRPDGAELTPRLTKARAILALLGTARDHRRPRAWLQDKLWSDRQPEQGAASLRHALTTIRAALGDDGDALIGEAGWIGLDARRVTVRLVPEAADAYREPPEFCEGLDVADPEFEDWIRDQRAAFERRLAETPPAPPPAAGAPPRARPADVRAAAPGPAAAPPPDSRRAEPRPAAPPPGIHPADPRPRLLLPGGLLPAETAVAVVVAPPEADDSRLERLGAVLNVQIAAQVSQMSGIEVLLEPLPATAQAPGEAVRLLLRLSRLGPSAFVQAHLLDPERGALLWATSRLLRVAGRGGTDPDEIGGFVAEVAAATGLELGRGGNGPDRAGMRAVNRALRGVLSYDTGMLAECDAALAAPQIAAGRAVRLAWRAHVRVIGLLERIAADPVEAAAEAVAFAAEALSADPLNPIVGALASDVALHVEKRPLKALELARTAAQRDAASPLILSTLSQAEARAGNPQRAHEAALRALRLSTGQPNRAWWSLRCCVTALRCGQLEEALRFARLSHEMSPDIRPPLRFLSALRFARGDEAGARDALVKLAALEPDFSLDLMASEDYPVASLRETGLLAVTASGLL